MPSSQYSVYPVDWKPDTTFRPGAKPAKEYPFTLDPFQKQAIEYIERNESVLVSAHTSAGKVRAIVGSAFVANSDTYFFCLRARSLSHIAC